MSQVVAAKEGFWNCPLPAPMGPSSAQPLCAAGDFSAELGEMQFPTAGLYTAAG